MPSTINNELFISLSLTKQSYPLLVGDISTLEESVKDFKKRRVRHQLDTRYKEKGVTLSEMTVSVGGKVAI
ncbi:hypothetical protein CN605_27975 [Bacillus toyonensis]|uniref:hypothetical protein n=1 Tax=Bacillus toyonensis TaxID=155322 RepID=UPI000BF07E02|nr:hypothetical protein [Bacillus toyonensis]PEL35493.1 hypothetical protein CN605_27975 [Bacillus toyonensis]